MCVCVAYTHTHSLACSLQENARLSARVAAQESVVCGLREERKLWGHELALQGATLAQERGRMEARIESLTGEVNSLKEQHKVFTGSIEKE